MNTQTLSLLERCVESLTEFIDDTQTTMANLASWQNKSGYQVQIDCNERLLKDLEAAIAAERSKEQVKSRQEPVAWRNKDGWIGLYKQGDATIPLYDSPQLLKPLSDEGIEILWVEGRYYKDFARAIEAKLGA